MPRCLFVALALASLVPAGAQRRPAPEFEVSLDTDPEERFAEVVRHFNASIHAFYQKFCDNFAAKGLLFELAHKRGPENEELQGEIKGVARLAGLPEYGIQALQMVYELQTLMVPIENITLPWRGPGCTGILAVNKADGMVYHARNLDFAPGKYMQDLAYVGIFTKSGKEVFRAQMIASYSFPLTAMKKGPNGFSLELNTRFLDHLGGNRQFLKNLLEEKRTFSGWTRRKLLEDAPDYETAVHGMATTPYISTEFNVIGGVRKGTILARNPDGLAYQLTLGQRNEQCRDDYVIITNFDFVYHDVREWFDPTGGKGIGHPRRLAAQRVLNASDALTPEVLFSAINDFGVTAGDTIFQAVMSVEKGLWNVSLPACRVCKGHANLAAPIEIARAAILV